MARRGRGTGRASYARTSSALKRMPTPAPPQDDLDEEMIDADAQTPDVATGEDDDTHVQDSDQPEDGSNPPTPKNNQSITRKRRSGRPPGRPPRAQIPDYGTPEPLADEGSDTGTPVKRRRGRPFAGGGWRGGFRGRARGGPRGPSHVTRPPIDREGNTMDVVDDEVIMPEDPEGEKRVDRYGYLQGQRDYRVRIFTIKGRGRRLYMLSTEPARCTGFRDSYLFFAKHTNLFKIIIDDYEKRDLIDRDIIPHSYKGRAIGVVTARSVFREFGSKIIIGGRKIVDDYYVQEALERGDVEGQLADPYDVLPLPGKPYNKNQYVAWHGASSVYHSNLPTVPMPSGRPWPSGKRKAAITSANWMFEHAREASRFNASLTAARRQTLKGVYDPHTNLVCYSRIMQPTHVRWERMEASLAPASASNQNVIRPVNGRSGQPNGTADSDQEMVNGTTDHSAQAAPLFQRVEQESTRFQPVSSLIARNYLVVDTCFLTPMNNTFPTPGSTITDPESRSIGSGPFLPDLTEKELVTLPDECRIAFKQAREAQQQWRNQWSTETRDGARGKLKIGVGGI